MDLLIGFLVFIVAMVASLVTGTTMIVGLFVGLLAFAIVGHNRGFQYKKIGEMAFGGIKDAFIVIVVMLIIGLITATWRASGTIAFFVNYGVEIITPPLFLIIAYLLSTLLSYALGTSFGVAGTVGVIFMALARSGGVDEVVTAGVIMSGIYFGDRGSPVSSAAVLVASCTKTKLIDNVKLMMSTAIVPLILTLGIYSILSINNPIEQVDVTVLSALREGFVLSWWEIVPAAIMLILPFLNVSIMWSMVASILSGGLIALIIQKMPLLDLLKTLILGYNVDGTLGQIINGGGLASMLEVVGILILSSTFSGIFEGTKMLDSILGEIENMMIKWGRFPVCVLISLASVVVFCNQTIATMICKDLMYEPYEKTGGNNQELAIDMENSVILLSSVVPWALACTVPLTFMGAGYGAMKYAFYIYLVPICYCFMKKHWFSTKRIRKEEQ